MGWFNMNINSNKSGFPETWANSEVSQRIHKLVKECDLINEAERNDLYNLSPMFVMGFLNLIYTTKNK